MSTSRFLRKKIEIPAKITGKVIPKVVQDSRNFDGSGVFEFNENTQKYHDARKHSITRKANT